VTSQNTAESVRLAEGVNTLVRLFLSYRTEDKKAATEIRDHLIFLGRERLRVFVSEVLPSGSEYRPKTLQELAKADTLILLYTDPNQQWDACLYESGFFDGKLFPDSTKRLIVLHGEACEPPPPLDCFVAVKVSATEREPLRQFIRELFAEPRRPGISPINPDVMDDRLAAYRKPLEDAIVEAVCGAGEKSGVFAKEIRIDVPVESLGAAEDNEVPSEARVFGDKQSLQLFALRENAEGYPWSQFYEGMDRASDHTSDWVGALANMMKTIALSSQDLDSTGLPLYRYRDDKRSEVYRPAVRSFRQKKGLLSFNVLFTDLPRETTAEPPGAATSLAQALTAARMLRWGVLKPLDDKVGDLNRRLEDGRLARDKWFDAVAKELHRFLGQKLTVLVEAFNRGYQRDELQGHFDGERRARLDDIFDRWDVWCMEAKEKADSFLRHIGDPDHIRKMTHQPLELNRQFMVLCAERYKEALEVP
jgi:hypothetical protein